jgi:hypothetical protein
LSDTWIMSPLTVGSSRYISRYDVLLR